MAIRGALSAVEQHFDRAGSAQIVAACIEAAMLNLAPPSSTDPPPLPPEPATIARHAAEIFVAVADKFNLVQAGDESPAAIANASL